MVMVVQVPVFTGVSSPLKRLEGDNVDPVITDLRAYRRGELEPDWPNPLDLDRIPKNAPTLRAAGEWVGTVMAVRMTQGLFDAAGVSTGLLAWLMGLDPRSPHDKRRASRWLHALERYRVIRQAGTMAVGGKPDGIRCFQPYDRDLDDLAACPPLVADLALEGNIERQPVVVLEPEPEVAEQIGMDDAIVPIGGREVGVIASGYATASDWEPAPAVQADKFTLGHTDSPPFMVARADDGSRSYRPMCRCVYNRAGFGDDGRCQGCGGFRREVADAVAA